MGAELFYYLLLIVLFAIACLFLSVLCRYANVKVTEGAGFSQPLEVLRGVAAFLVFGAHSTMYFGLAPNQVASASMGEIGVLLFFMLTGHLFWGQIKANKFDSNTFFIKRIRRLFPIMLVVIGTISFVDWITAGVPVPTMRQLLALFRNFGFGFGNVVDSVGNVNDVFNKDMYLRINTIWTLRWEWLFYLCMPIFAALATLPKITGFAIAIILLFMDPFAILNGGTDAVFVIAFWLGALSRSMEDYRSGILSNIFSRSGSNVILVIGIVLVSYHLFGGDLVRKNIRVPILLFLVFPAFFYFVASKYFVDRFSWAPLQLLGKISYSFYLWHLGVNFYVFRLVSGLFDKPQSVTSFVISCLAMMIVGLTLSTFSYRYIEEPFLKKSKHNTI